MQAIYVDRPWNIKRFHYVFVHIKMFCFHLNFVFSNVRYFSAEEKFFFKNNTRDVWMFLNFVDNSIYSIDKIRRSENNRFVSYCISLYFNENRFLKRIVLYKYVKEHLHFQRLEKILDIFHSSFIAKHTTNVFQNKPVILFTRIIVVTFFWFVYLV